MYLCKCRLYHVYVKIVRLVFFIFWIRGSRKYMYLYSAQRGFVEIARRGGVVSKTKIFKGMYESKLEGMGGRGTNQKVTIVGVWIFSGTSCWSILHHNCKLLRLPKLDWIINNFVHKSIKKRK